MAENDGGGKQANPTKDVMDVLFPGETFKLEVPGSPQRIKVTVWPIAVEQLGTFTGELAAMAGVAIRSVQQRLGDRFKDAGEEELAKVVMSSLVPYGLGKAMPLILQSVKVEVAGGKSSKGGAEVAGASIDPRKLPHWYFPQMVTSWLRQSFGTESARRPWLEALETGIQRLTGRRISISEAVSALWSERASQFGTFFTSASQEAPTEAGPSPSTTSGSPGSKAPRPAAPVKSSA